MSKQRQLFADQTKADQKAGMKCEAYVQGTRRRCPHVWVAIYHAKDKRRRINLAALCAEHFIQAQKAGL